MTGGMWLLAGRLLLVAVLADWYVQSALSCLLPHARFICNSFDGVSTNGNAPK
ncbi:hypothetical protein PF010_g4582 [Phytophthora fragariae]|uniref:Uncharacterized protein n=1 Tax=Phytophthora fragariae TaxID=53985 RepID=A0A6A4ED77_9STRA|nr:hypothetical protein PF003_g22397 [Phytophthora fragariae]KAE8944599.1 hypothetical protein PF009_g5739 [Phytophthora fragariae]KAE9023168.1 hypothetical protein PF011_g4124 [Phytophthora fragariae]KAE9127760.1 hypothetical protein PF007_g5506 [Phytophthora fragariae]KAE9128246.1 hypothetical protein PF010_g4582 [Phytophthora fragariae]